MSGGMGGEIGTILIVLDTVYHRQSYSTNEGLCTMKYVLSIIITLAIIYIVPFILYATSTVVCDLEPPEDVAPWQFLLGILVTKIGTAIAFVLLYQFSKVELHRKWSLYAFIWWLSFAISELGQAIGPHYTWKEAIIGIISEAIYFPLAAVFVDFLIGREVGDSRSIQK